MRPWGQAFVCRLVNVGEWSFVLDWFQPVAEPSCHPSNGVFEGLSDHVDKAVPAGVVLKTNGFHDLFDVVLVEQVVGEWVIHRAEYVLVDVIDYRAP